MNRNDEKEAARRTRGQYTEQKPSGLDELRALDGRVKRPAVLFAYTLGIAGTLVLGTGMCLAMNVIGNHLMLPGVLIGMLGILAVSVNYPLYRKLFSRRRKRYATEIMRVSSRIIEE